MHLFLEANVLFAAAWQDGRARALFTLAPRVGSDLLTSFHALEQARRNLEAKRPEVLPVLEGLREAWVLVAEPPPALVRRAQAWGLPLKDAPILAAAWMAGVTLLVTGDRRHFGPLMGQTVKGVRVVSLKDALEEILVLAGL
ncbi:DNA-binding protein [Thermus sp.]|uniref:DNA-binding protein n=1 Tax=Thermus sp. TaxID=275 RepID=UPI00307EBDC7